VTLVESLFQVLLRGIVLRQSAILVFIVELVDRFQARRAPPFEELNFPHGVDPQT